MSVRKQRKGGLNYKKWSESEENLILSYLLDLAPRNREFEKPNKKEFYKKMAEELSLAVSDSNQTMNKVRNMRTLYIKAVDWKSNTGQGVESGTVEDRVKQMCPYFDILEEIFGHKTNVVPPYIYESSSANDHDIENVQSRDNYYETVDVEEHLQEHLPGIFDGVDRGEHRHQVSGVFSSGIDCQEDEFHEDGVNNDECTILDEDVANDINDSEKARFRKLMTTTPTTPLISTPKTNSKTESTKNVEKENISRFKKRLLNSPVTEKDKTMSRNASSILADAQNKKAEAILGRNDIEKCRAENEKLCKLEEVSLAKDKFHFEKEIRKSDLELRKMEIELRDKEIASRERIEMFRIEMEAKNKLEIAKLKHQNT